MAMANRLIFRPWVLALAVISSQNLSCITTDALSVQRLNSGAHHHHQHYNHASATGPTAVLFSDNQRLVNHHQLSMSKSSSSPSQTTTWSELTVPELKAQLKSRNLPVSGVKAALIQRLEEHDDGVDDGDDDGGEEEENNNIQSNSKKRSIAFPPPKDDTEIHVIEKEVQDTVRMLDGLKLGDQSLQSSSVPSSAGTTPSRRLSRQQQQEKELMQGLKDSLKQSQQHQNNNNGNSQQQRTTTASVQPAAAAASSSEQSSSSSAHAEKMKHYTEQLRLRPANDLKTELSSLRLPVKGRKPDLVNRLAEYYVEAEGYTADKDETTDFDLPVAFVESTSSLNLDRPVSFAGIPRLSSNAANALHRAFGGEEDETGSSSGSTLLKPTPIQSVAISKLYHPPNPSALLHAPTGSGKSIAFLLPITETLWKEVEESSAGMNANVDNMENGLALILLPTRELAAQVAGVASVLAPPGMVRLVPRPMDLMACWKDEVDRGEEFEYYENEGNDDNDGDESTNNKGRKYQPRILVGSAKSISSSLFGDKKMPGTPTSKPEGKKLLINTRWLVLDEVDRLLNVKKTRTDKKSRRHEKPAAMLAAAVSRLTVGRVQVVAASATVGRPLRRELARVLGLHGSECPETLRGEDDAARLGREMEGDDKHVGRAVKIPDAVRNYVLPVDGSTSGSLLTSAAFASKAILGGGGEGGTGRRALLVLTRNCGIQVHNAMGALRHFGIRPEPRSLLDVLEADGADRLVEAHRKMSRVEGVGGKARQQKTAATLDGGEEEEGYLLVTHEDNVRGLHLDGLDAVIVVGRPGSPDEYTHIAGRTGRAGRRGSVLNVVSYEQAAALASWTMMLGVDFLPVDESEVAGILDA